MSRGLTPHLSAGLQIIVVAQDEQRVRDPAADLAWSLYGRESHACRVRSVKNMVECLLGFTSSHGRKIDSVVVFGQGNSRSQSVGALAGHSPGDSRELVPVPRQHRSKAEEPESKALMYVRDLQARDDFQGRLQGDAHQQLERLRGHFTVGARVVLKGYNAARGADSQPLLRLVSSALGGVIVCATARREVSITGLGGPLICANPGSWWLERSGHDLWGRPRKFGWGPAWDTPNGLIDAAQSGRPRIAAAMILKGTKAHDVTTPHAGQSGWTAKSIHP